MLKIRLGAMLLVNATVSVCAALLVSEAMTRVMSVYEHWQLLRASLIAMFISVVLMYSVRCYAGTVPVPYADAVSDVHRYIRGRGLVYSERHGTFTVRLGKYSSAKVHVRGCQDGAEVFFSPYGTQNGRGLVIILAVLGYSLPVALAISVRFALSARLFASEVLAHLSAPGRSIAESQTRETTKELLETSLTEARRIALETYEARRSDYHDYVLLLVMGCIAAAVLGLILLLMHHDSPIAPEFGLWLLGSAAAASAAALSGIWMLRRRMTPEIDHLREWVERLELQLVVESMETPLDEQSETSFEVLAAVGKELPGWLSSRRRSGSFFHPWTSMLILVLGFLTYSFVMSGITWQGFGKTSWVSFLAAAVTATLAVYLHRWMKKTVAAERAQFCDGWRSRWDAMMSDSDRLLGEG